MGLSPKVDPKVRPPFVLRECTVCGKSQGPNSYIRTNSYFYPDGYIPMCNDCLKKLIVGKRFDWDTVDRLCRYLDIPFVPREFERLHKMNGDDVFPVYAEVFHNDRYKGLGWKEYNEEFLRLQEANQIEDELPLISEEKITSLKRKFGSNYDDEALFYLENFYEGLMRTQNINGALQLDQALKLSKISYEIDCRIREGSDFDKLLKSYDSLVKTAEFTPKNTKNSDEFESTGELFRWLEKRGWVNRYYDNVTRDVVDETLKNIQNFNQRLYINESGIGEEINQRMDALKNIQEMENFYDIGQGEYDLDAFEADGFGVEEDEEEFSLDLGVRANV